MFSFRTAMAALWVAGCIAAFFYAQHQHIPAAVAVPVGLAFLVELTLFAGLNRSLLPTPVLLGSSALVPYLLYSLPTGQFQAKNLLILVVVAFILAFWLEKTRSLDFLFLAFIGVVYLSKVFRSIYPDPFPDLHVYALGQLMWFRIAITAVLQFRPNQHVAFGWAPTRRDWAIGIRYFVLMIPVALVLNYAVDFAKFSVVSGYWWKAPATFLGILWVVALFEEVMFRGLMLQRLYDRYGWAIALAATSIVFGFVHLWYRGFPNWKFAIMATALGVFYGYAYRDSGGVRGAMVTHALTVTTWKTLFS